jgi:hypothetical protein
VKILFWQGPYIEKKSRIQSIIETKPIPEDTKIVNSSYASCTPVFVVTGHQPVVQSFLCKTSPITAGHPHIMLHAPLRVMSWRRGCCCRGPLSAKAEKVAASILERWWGATLGSGGGAGDRGMGGRVLGEVSYLSALSFWDKICGTWISNNIEILLNISNSYLHLQIQSIFFMRLKAMWIPVTHIRAYACSIVWVFVCLFITNKHSRRYFHLRAKFHKFFLWELI